MPNDQNECCRGAGDIAKGALAGMIGGALGAWSMNQFHAIVKKITSTSHSSTQSPHESSEHSDNPSSRRQQRAQSQHKSEPATVKLAEAVSRNVFQHPLSRQEKQVAGPGVHYGYAALMGGIYGALAEVAPMVTTGGGLGYASALWLLGDEMAVPLLGLSKGPSQTPLPKHASALGAHLVYGLTLELARRALKG